MSKLKNTGSRDWYEYLLNDLEKELAEKDRKKEIKGSFNELDKESYRWDREYCRGKVAMAFIAELITKEQYDRLLIRVYEIWSDL